MLDNGARYSIQHSALTMTTAHFHSSGGATSASRNQCSSSCFQLASHGVNINDLTLKELSIILHSIHRRQNELTTAKITQSRVLYNKKDNQIHCEVAYTLANAILHSTTFPEGVKTLQLSYNTGFRDPGTYPIKPKKTHLGWAFLKKNYLKTGFFCTLVQHPLASYLTIPQQLTECTECRLYSVSEV